MQIWVDADACPTVIRDILFRAADRARMRVTLVANQPVRRAVSPYIHFVQVPAGLNVADARIVEMMEAGDLVITAEVPLASYMLYNEFKSSDVAYFQRFYDLFSDKGIFDKRVLVEPMLYKA